MKRIFLLSWMFCINLLVAEEYQFEGNHFFASYLGCDLEALSNPMGVLDAMDQAVKASGAYTLDRSYYVFEPDAITIVYLLSESHASIHTYPEHGACFVDLFTCGSHCSAEGFDQILRAYFKPEKVSFQHFVRAEECTLLSTDG